VHLPEAHITSSTRSSWYLLKQKWALCLVTFVTYSIRTFWYSFT
jgi:hypothetical protein